MAHLIDYDRVADRYDRRYDVFACAGIGDALLKFTGESAGVAAEVGCGSGHWLALLANRGFRILGIDPSSRMLARAARIAPDARLVRGRATKLPLADASCDRLLVVNALHHFGDRFAFFLEARRVLRPGGGVLTVGLDPHVERDRWWVYDFFDGPRELNLARFAPTRTLRGELARAGFALTESFEADRIDMRVTVPEALEAGIVDRAFCSELATLPDEEYEAGLGRVQRADRERTAAGESLTLVTDLRFYATTGWV